MSKAFLFILPVMWVVACSHTPDPGAGSAGYVGREDATWNAWTNDMPPGPRSLHVVGEVTLSNGRYVAQIKPSGETPGVHCLIEVIDNGGMGTTALTNRKVHFIDTKYDGSDELVTVHFPDGSALDIPIESAE